MGKWVDIYMRLTIGSLKLVVMYISSSNTSDKTDPDRSNFFADSPYHTLLDFITQPLACLIYHMGFPPDLYTIYIQQ